MPPQSHVYIGSTEPPSFFAPLRDTYRLHFAEDFRRQLTNITNNYALYAVETLIFFGSQMSVESYSFQSAWFADACFPAAGMRAARQGLSRSRHAVAASPQRAVDVQCRDQTGVLINGVLYGPACISNAPCGKRMALVPQPRSCGVSRLSERLMLGNRSARSVGMRKCAALGSEGRRAPGIGSSSFGGGRGKKHGAGTGKLAASQDAQAEVLERVIRTKEEELDALRAEWAAMVARKAGSKSRSVGFLSRLSRLGMARQAN